MKIAVSILLLFITNISFSAEFTVTIDDPNVYDTPLYSPIERDQKILKQLEKHNLKIALFVCGKRVDSKAGKELLKRWDKKGHLIGNHTYSHLYFNSPKISFKEYSSDFLKVEKQIKDLDNFAKIFRFPYLKSGNTKEKRDLMRSLLAEKGYKYGYVTVDASDWYISSRLEKRLKQSPNSDIKKYKDFYLKHMWERATYYDELAKKTIGRSPKHNLLIHHNLLNSLFLDDLISFFKNKGWKLVDADKVFDDPIYAHEPDIIPSGESIVWALAKEKGILGLRYPAEDGKYEKDEMDKLGL